MNDEGGTNYLVREENTRDERRTGMKKRKLGCTRKG
jgi:hypothetical protein